MRLAGVLTAVVIALAAAAAGLAPALLRHRRAPAVPAPPVVVYAYPVAGGPPARLPAEPSRVAMGAPAGIHARLAHGVLTVRGSGGRLIWRRRVGTGARGFRLAPDGLSALLARAAGIELVTPVSERYVMLGRGVEPAYSPDGRTVYVLGANAATSIPK